MKQQEMIWKLFIFLLFISLIHILTFFRSSRKYKRIKCKLVNIFVFAIWEHSYNIYYLHDYIKYFFIFYNLKYRYFKYDNMFKFNLEIWYLNIFAWMIQKIITIIIFSNLIVF